MESVKAIDVKLYKSSLDGDIDGVRVALFLGGRVDWRHPKGGTSLFAAADYGHINICRLLLGARARV